MQKQTNKTSKRLESRELFFCVFDKEKTRLNKSKISKNKTNVRKWKCVTPLATSLKSPATAPEI